MIVVARSSLLLPIPTITLVVVWLQPLLVLLLLSLLAGPYRHPLPSVTVSEAFAFVVVAPRVPNHRSCRGGGGAVSSHPPRPVHLASAGVDHIGSNRACRRRPPAHTLRRVLQATGGWERRRILRSSVLFSSSSDDEDGRAASSNGGRKNISDEESTSDRGAINRREVLSRSTAFVAAALAAVSTEDVALAAGVTDETGVYANRAYDSSYRDLPTASGTKTTTSTSSELKGDRGATDEFVVRFSRSDLYDGDEPRSLGIELGQVTFRTNTRVVVRSVSPGSPADAVGIKKGLVIVAINGRGAERTDARGVRTMVRDAVANLADGRGGSSLEITFRDPEVFRDSLEAGRLSEGQSVTTQVAPEGDTTQRNARTGKPKFGEAITSQSDQKVTVTQLKAPLMCNRGADVDDLLETSYVGSVVETGAIFDGSTVSVDGRGIPGRAGDVSLFFVLGKQPFGQFPPGWDVGLYGMCVGERRRLVIPPVLAYGSKGLPKRGIPPDATLQYDVTLVSINGLATPQ